MLIEQAPRTASAVAIIVGFLVLIGWVSGWMQLKSVFLGLVAMKVNTAFGFILAGISLWNASILDCSRVSRIVSQLCAASVLLLGLLTIGEYLSAKDFGIDQLLMREITNLPGDIPGRMAVGTAVDFIALGAALWLLTREKGGFILTIHILAIGLIVVAGSALVGYGYNIESFIRAKLNYTPMAINTAVVFVALALGIVNARPNYPFRRLMISDSSAGIIVRWLLPATIIFTIAIGWLIQRGYEVGYFSEVFGLALFTVTSVAGLSTLILGAAAVFDTADIQRKRAEDKVRMASLYARSLLEASLDPLVTISAEGKVTDVNEATVQATGVSRDKLIGSDFSDYFTEPDKARAGYQEVFAKGFITDYPLAIRHMSGKIMEVLYNASVYRDEKGKIAGVFAAARDITERKQAEERLRTASLYARSLLEASLDPLVTISAEGKVTDVNEATVQATGVSRHELIGSGFSDYFTEPDKAQASYQEVFAKGFVTDYPLAIRHVSGKIIEVLYNASVYHDEKGEVAGVFAAARDITERKRAEEEVRRLNAELELRVEARTAELRAANAELDSFAYAVSHDLRAPLRAMNGFSQALLEDYGERLDGDARVYLDQIIIASRRMSDLIDGLLVLSRSTRGELKQEALDISVMAGRLLKEMAATEPARQVAWTVEPGMQVKGDATMIEVVMRNLIDNAWKYTGKTTDATIRVYTGETEDQQSFCVSDNGAGFDMAFADKLFQPFQRLHRQEEFPGVGIGLSTVQRIVHRHGGAIWAEGAPGQGATFCFTLHNLSPPGKETS
ncbi:MAG: sensor histidine kinase [Methylomonas sp.]